MASDALLPKLAELPDRAAARRFPSPLLLTGLFTCRPHANNVPVGRQLDYRAYAASVDPSYVRIRPDRSIAA